jgi:hypothetical protein
MTGFLAGIACILAAMVVFFVGQYRVRTHAVEAGEWEKSVFPKAITPLVRVDYRKASNDFRDRCRGFSRKYMALALALYFLGFGLFFWFAPAMKA